jgi:hypothetical protein
MLGWSGLTDVATASSNLIQILHGIAFTLVEAYTLQFSQPGMQSVVFNQ